MVVLEQKIDIITYVAIVNGRRMIVWEFENYLATAIHLMARKIEIDLANNKID